MTASGTATESEEKLESERAMGETLMLGLRLLKGVSIEQFEDRFQTSFQKTYGKAVESLLEKNLIRVDNNRLALSENGLFLADSVILEFMIQASHHWPMIPRINGLIKKLLVKECECPAISDIYEL